MAAILNSRFLLWFAMAVALMSHDHRVNSEPTQDKQALLAFLSRVPHASRVQWNASVSACTWVGVQCDDNSSFVFALRLPGVGLVGNIPANTLGRLSRLRVLSLRSNRLTGSIPQDFSNLKLLRSLYLQNNLFSGGFPEGITGLTRLIRLDMSSNNFSGPIPFAVNNLGNLTRLYLQNNGFNGTIPSINPLGRKEAEKTQKPSEVTRAAAAAAAGEAGTSSSKDDVTGGSMEGERNKLVFFDGGGYSFDLEDLLRASAEVLGKGSVGTSYKAVLEEGTTVVVKRLKDVAVSRKEFEQQLEGLGKLKNENVLPLRAFYFSKDEKLLVFDYMPAGSLSALLHGSRGSGRTPLDWDTRMKIALCAARGLAYLHAGGKVVHGNIKASNILLKLDNHEACLSDYGLNPLFSSSTPVNHRVAGYRAPEVLETRKVTFKSDVYSYGVLLLELLTGKSPNQASLGEEGIDLPRWVQSVVREEWTAEVFDVELMRYHNVEEEMVQLLQIGMACVAMVPDQRPSMPDVVRMMEEINRGGETDEGLRRQSSDDPSKGSDTQTPPQEPRASPP
nr:putative inactive receptor kinase [Ipomoea trifida]